jgi:hypothetical protein
MSTTTRTTDTGPSDQDDSALVARTIYYDEPSRSASG